MAVPTMAGKTSPRILEDLLRYDPRLEERAQRNVLTSLPPHFDPAASNRRPAIPYGSCSHTLILKPAESITPPADAIFWTTETQLKVSTICSQCKFHFDLSIHHQRQSVAHPCGTIKGQPLHHFAFQGMSHGGNYVAPEDLTADPRLPSMVEYRFVCQFDQCNVALNVLCRPPAILPEDYTLLTDPERLKKQHRIVQKDHRDAKSPATPALVLATLRVYLGNSLDPKWEPRTIPFTHKKFLALFGEGTDPFLHRLGFRPTPENHPDGLGRWMPPVPTNNDDVWRTPDRRTYLRDVFTELGMALWDFQPHERDEVAPRMSTYPLTPKISAVAGIERILSCGNYEKKPGARQTRSTRSDEEDHPHYASLGAVADFSDSLIIFAWKTQSQFDKLERSYYLDCLRGIATGRGSEPLSVQVALAESEGVYDRKTIDEAFRCLGIDPAKGPTLSADQILNHYNVRYQDVGESTRVEMRRMKDILARALELSSLQDTHDELLDTYEACLNFLEADDSYSDEFIQVAYQAKVKAENEVSMTGEKLYDRSVNRARHAVKKIAEHRNSEALMAFIMTETEDEMVTNAYNFFNIKERDGYLDPEMIDMYAVSHKHDNVFDWVEIERHRDILVQYLQRRFPDGKRSSTIISPPAGDPRDIPAGLRNIGNTCYLASVLQFLYSVKVFRAVVMAYPDNRETNTNGKFINGIMYGSNEVALGQAFVGELKDLFNLMETSTARVVEPSRRLAILTLLTGAQYSRPRSPSVRRRSTLSGPTKTIGLGLIDGVVVQGPSLPQSSTPAPVCPAPVATAQGDSDQETLIDGSDKAVGSTDVAMDVDSTGPDPRSKAGEKRKKSLEEGTAAEATNSQIGPESKADENTKPDNAPEGPTVSPSTGDASATSLKGFNETQSKLECSTEQTAPPKPDRPPPIPPRRHPEEEKFHEAEAASQQQDVNEVMGFINLKVQWAIKQRNEQGFEAPGDPIQDLFYWKMMNFKPNEKEAYHSQLQTEITAYLHDGPRHIYDVLDGEFGLENVLDSTNTRTVYKRYGAIQEPSPFFQVSVARAVMNYETSRAEKIEHKLELVDTLYLDRYIASDDPLHLKKREESWKLRAEIDRLKEAKKAHERVQSLKTLPDSLDTVSEYLDESSSLSDASSVDNVTDSAKSEEEKAAKRRSASEQSDAPPVLKKPRSGTPTSSLKSGATLLSQRLRRVARELGEDKSKLGERIETAEKNLARLFDDDEYRKHKYRLYAVFMHRGGAHGGHYWINIRDFRRGMDEDNACWRKYNDESVTEIQDWRKEVFEQEERHPATPYHIVYVRESNILSHTEPLHRNIPVLESAESGQPATGTALTVGSSANENVATQSLGESLDKHMLDPPRQPIDRTIPPADSGASEPRRDIEMQDLSPSQTVEAGNSSAHRYGLSLKAGGYEDHELLQDLVTSDNELGLSSDDTYGGGDDGTSVHSIDRAKPVQAPEFF